MSLQDELVGCLLREDLGKTEPRYDRIDVKNFCQGAGCLLAPIFYKDRGHNKNCA